MPQIPEWGIPKQNLTTEPLAPQVSAEVAGKAAGATDMAIGASLDAVVKTGEHFLKLYDDNQEMVAKNAAATQLMQIQADALNDPDPFTAGARMQAKMAQVGQEAAKGIANAQVRNRFLAEYDLDATQKYFSTNTHLMQKQVKVAQANRLEYYDKLSTEYATADPYSRTIILDKLNDQIKTDVRDGLWTPLQGNSFNKTYSQQSIQNQVDQDLLTDPAMVKKQLQLGENGEYAGLDAKSVNLAIKDADAQIKKLKAVDKVNKETAIKVNENDIMKTLRKKDSIPESTINRMADNGQISERFAAATIKKINSSAAVTAKTDNKTFSYIVDAIFDETNKPEDIRTVLLEENAKGNISNEDFAMLDEYIDTVTDKSVDAMLSKAYPKTGWQSISTWSDEYAGARHDVKVALFKDYNARVKKGVDPQLALQEATNKQTLNLKPAIATWVKGQLVIDLNGRMKKSNPDGSLENAE